MIRCDSKNFKSSRRLVDGLRMDTKENLKMWAKLLGFSIPVNLRKEEYTRKLASAILQCPQEWLPLLTRFELTLLKKLVEVGANSFVEEREVIVVNTLEFLGLVMIDYCDDIEGVVHFMICDELREAVAPYLDAILTSEEQQTRNTIEQYVYGILNLYGMISILDLNDKLNECLETSYTKDEVYWAVLKSILLRRHSFEMVDIDASEIWVQSPFLSDPDELEAKWAQRPEMKKAKHFSLQEVFEAGNMPTPHLPVSGSDKLRRYMMTRLNYTEAATDFHLNMLWYAMQIEANPMSAINPIISRRLSSMQELQEAIELFSEYCNQCPRWFFRGYSSDEVFRLFDKDRFKKSQKFNQMFDEVLSGKKVGRNDPCPCGSGKKYKHCCGGN